MPTRATRAIKATKVIRATGANVKASCVEDPAGDIILNRKVLPHLMFKELSQFLSGPIWKYGHYSNARRDRFCFWNAEFAGGGGTSRKSCETELLSNPHHQPVAAVWLVLKQTILAGHEPLRVYANAHTFGVEGFIHIDNPDTENYFTTIIYAHPAWHPDWGGELIFYDQDMATIIKAVAPASGLLVHFHGSTPHCAKAISRDCAELRISLVIKTQIAGKPARAEAHA